jgi:hypothetical protein
MRNPLWLLFVVAAFSTGTLAAPIKLKCTTEDGKPAADLTVDVSAKLLSWGATRYRIRAIDDRYISAYLEAGDTTGGEVWVFDRVSGEYLRAGVAITWNSPDDFSKKPGTLTAATYRGKCTKPII